MLRSAQNAKYAPAWGRQLSLAINADENEAVNTFFDYHNVVQDAVHAVQSSGHDFLTGASSSPQANAASDSATKSETPQDGSK